VPFTASSPREYCIGSASARTGVGDAYFEYQGEGGAAPVIFGETGDEPLLGATTLESLGLVLDPFKRRLIAMRLLPV
jgi:hypothetical protein